MDELLAVFCLTVLQGVQGEVGAGGYGFLIGIGVDAKHAAFFVELVFVKHELILSYLRGYGLQTARRTHVTLPLPHKYVMQQGERDRITVR